VISSILNPEHYEADLRPIIGAILIIIIPISIVLIKYWDYFKEDFDSDWEL